MKKLLIFLLIIGVILGVGYYFVTDRVEKEAVEQIETRLTQSFGEQVEVEAVEVSPVQGRAVIREFKAPARQGKPFREQLSFGELEMDIDYLGRKIDTLRLLRPVINVEIQDTPSNRRYQPDTQGQKLEIDRVVIQSAMLGVYDPAAGDLKQFQIGDITLSNLSGTAEQVADQIMQAVAAQIPDSRAADDLLREGRRHLPGLNQEFEQAWEDLGG